jgi:hypothetical protein
MSQPEMLDRKLESVLQEQGTPLFLESSNGVQYVMFRVSLERAIGGGFRAYIDDFIPLYGEGATQQEALIAFHELLQLALGQPKHD